MAKHTLLSECATLKELNAELVDALESLLCRIAVNGDVVRIISDGYTIREINKALAVIAKATGEEAAADA